MTPTLLHCSFLAHSTTKSPEIRKQLKPAYILSSLIPKHEKLQFLQHRQRGILLPQEQRLLHPLPPLRAQIVGLQPKDLGDQEKV